MTHRTPEIPTGLTEEEAQSRLAAEGFNEIPGSHQRGWIAMALDVAKEPMLLLLIACGVLYLLAGETSDAMMLLGFVLFIMGITFYQERKTERAVEALRDLASPRALVIRDGAERRIAGREVARGDIIVVSEGDRIPADATLLQASYVSVDESLLTGESVPVCKIPCKDNGAPPIPGGDGMPWLFSGTLVVKGKGIAEVTTTGANTEMGKIGKALQSVESGETLLSRQTGKVVRRVAIVAIILCVLVAVLYTLIGENTSWRDGALVGLSLAMAMIPEEFPVVLSIFLAMGAWRISRKQVLTRRIPAVEALGAATVLCVDKTGTLTLNKMTVAKIAAGGKIFNIQHAPEDVFPEAFHEVVEFGILASQIDPFDPMEKAFRELGKTRLHDTEHLHDDWDLEQEYPLTDSLLAMSHVWRARGSGRFVVAAKGAPEAIADLCHLPEEALRGMEADIQRLAGEGLRVLAVARTEIRTERFPESQHDFPFEYLGLVGFADPIRSSVPAAITECRHAGIRVVMITGDYPATARNIARQIGLPEEEGCITGPELEKMDDAELANHVGHTCIFARVVPEQKLRIVNAYKACGEVVAMTGDGVNDAPALKAADIGVAMGGRGADVAREAAHLVLLDDDFTSIVHAVRLGRRIFDNLKKAFAYILAVHVPIAGLSLLPVLFKWPLILLPVHIVFLEMVIDPTCSVVLEVEPEEPGVMDRPPRRCEEPLLSRITLMVALAQGLGILALTMGLFGVFRWLNYSDDDARTVTFTALLIASLALVTVNRSWSSNLFTIIRTPNSAVWWVILASTSMLMLVTYIPGLRGLFHFTPMHWRDLAIALGVGVVSIIWLDAVKNIAFWMHGARQN